MKKYNDIDLFHSIKKDIEEIVSMDDLRSANIVLQKLKELLKKKNYISTNREIYDKYNKIIIKLKWIALPALDEGAVQELFKNHFKESFKIDEYDLSEKFRCYLMGMALHENRDIFKKKIRNILEKNKALMSIRKLENGDTPSVENWLKSYISKMGLKSVDSVKLNKYFLVDKNFNRLSSTDKKKISILINFYEKLKLSSLSSAGIEEEIPVNTDTFKGYIKNGNFIKEDLRVSRKFELISKTVERVLNKNKILSGISGDGAGKNALLNLAVEEDLNNEKKTKELNIMLTRFPKDSIQYKAIGEEIDKVKKNNKLLNEK